MRHQTTPIFRIALSFLIGIFLTIIPLPHWAIWFRPQWIFSILLFWVMMSPAQCGIGVAFFSGIFLDIITGMPIGAHALVFVILIYFILKLQTVVVHFPMIQQTCTVGIFAMLNVLLQGLLLHLMGRDVQIVWGSLSVVTTALIWPWLFLLLDRLQPRAFIR